MYCDNIQRQNYQSKNAKTKKYIFKRKKALVGFVTRDVSEEFIASIFRVYKVD
jgi:hypothetical protein